MAELFQNFEVDRIEPRGPRLLRLLGGSVALHLVLLVAVIYIPTVRAAFQITSILSNVSFVDQDYDKTAIGERAVMLDLSNSNGKLRYPDGYFATASGKPIVLPTDPVLVAQVNPTPLPMPIFRPRPVSIPKPRPTPSATPTPTPAASPVAVVAQNNQPVVGETAGGVATPSPSPGQPKAETELEKMAEESGAKKFPAINTKPFKDWLAKANEMKEGGEIDLGGTLEMTVEADRQPDGKLDNLQVTGAAADNPKLYELIKALVQALSDSAVLKVLEETRHLQMTVKIDQQLIDAKIVTEATSPDAAGRLANGYSLLLAAARLKKSGREEEAILKSLKVASDGKQINVTFNMPRTQASEMLKKQLPPAAPAS